MKTKQQNPQYSITPNSERFLEENGFCNFTDLLNKASESMDVELLLIENKLWFEDMRNFHNRPKSVSVEFLD